MVDQSAKPAKSISVKLIIRATKIGSNENKNNKIIAGAMKKYGVLLLMMLFKGIPSFTLANN